jgi:hypothetical protein
LTFAVSILDAPVPVAKAAVAAPEVSTSKATPEDVSGEDIDSWLIGEGGGVAPDQPTAVYGGDTITITAFKDATAAPSKPPSSATDDEYERQSEDVEEPEEGLSDMATADEEVIGIDDASEEETSEEIPEEFIDESNPFYAAKKAQQQAKEGGPAKPSFKDTSDAAGDILRRLMERRRASKSS